MEDGDTNTNTTISKGNETDKKIKEAETTSTDEATDDVSLYEKTRRLVERLEEANKVQAENIARQEKLASESLLGGTTTGRIEPKEPEISEKDYAEMALKGQVGTKPAE